MTSVDVVLRHGDAETDLSVDVDCAATVAEILDVAGVDHLAMGTVTVDGRMVSAEVPPREAGLSQASVITAGDAPDAPAEAVLELCVVAGPLAGTRVPLTHGSWLVGRSSDAEVALDHPTVS